MSDGIKSSKMMNLALTSKGQLRNRLPMSYPSVHTRRVGVCPCTQIIFWYFSVAQNSESNLCCGSLESCSRSSGRSLSWGGGSFRTDSTRSYFGHAKKDQDILEPDRTIRIRS